MLLLIKFGSSKIQSYIYKNKIIMEKQQTAVEWLFLMMNNPNKDQELANKLYDKAKEMEQEQIMNAWVKGVVSEGDMTARQYYNETYKK